MLSDYNIYIFILWIIFVIIGIKLWSHKTVWRFIKRIFKKKPKDFKIKKINRTPLYKTKFFPSKTQVLYFDKILNHLENNYKWKYVLITETPLSSLFESSKKKKNNQIKEYLVDFIVLKKQEDGYKAILAIQVDNWDFKKKEIIFEEAFESSDILLIFIKWEIEFKQLSKLIDKQLST